MIFLKNFDEKEYYIPIEKKERFLQMKRRLRDAHGVDDYCELYAGLRVAFGCEFDRYLIKFCVGDLWKKKTESWMGNAPRGSVVKICGIHKNFILHCEVKKKFGIFWKVGYTTYLNKLCFLGIYER